MDGLFWKVFAITFVILFLCVILGVMLGELAIYLRDRVKRG